MCRWVMQFTEHGISRAIPGVVGQTGRAAAAKNFLTFTGDPAMQIKPTSHHAAKPVAAPPPAKPAAGDKPGDFAQLLKASQAEAATATPAPARS